MTSPTRAPDAIDGGAREQAQPSRRLLPNGRVGLLGILLLACALAFVPVVAGSHLTALIARYLLLGLLAMSLDLIWGYTGQLSLGHAAFFGLGAYSSGLLLSNAEGVAASYAAVGLGILVPAVLGFIMGALLFRGGVSGVYFAIVTLLVSLLLEQLAITWSELTGGINGLFGMAPLEFGVLTIQSLEAAYWFILVMTVAAYLLARWLVRTPFGRSMVAIRSNEPRAQSLGYPTVAIKTAVFTLSCAIAGLAGLLYVPLERFVYPTQLGLVASTAVVVWVVIGGRGVLIGGFVGAFVIEYLASALSGQLQEYWVLVTGLILIVVVMALPGGLTSLVTGAGSFAKTALARWGSRA